MPGSTNAHRCGPLPLAQCTLALPRLPGNGFSFAWLAPIQDVHHIKIGLVIAMALTDWLINLMAALSAEIFLEDPPLSDSAPFCPCSSLSVISGKKSFTRCSWIFQIFKIFYSHGTDLHGLLYGLHLLWCLFWLSWDSSGSCSCF